MTDPIDDDNVTVVPVTAWTVLPPPPGVCVECARDHEPEQPHDAQSLHYQVKFMTDTGREPTWGDAMAHCDPDTQAAWTRALNERGVSW